MAATDTTTPLLLQAAFRPFFLCAGIAALVVMLRLVAVLTGFGSAPAMGPFAWHGHEMLFGFVAAAIAGFLLTAVANWTNTPPISGAPVAALLALWLVARIDLWDGMATGWGLSADIAFLPGVAAIAAARIGWPGRLRQWLPVLAVLAIALGNAAWHASGHLAWLQASAILEVTTLAIALLIAVIGGRITPAFTRNRLRAQEREPAPRDDDVRDWLALGASAAVLVTAALWPPAAAPLAGIAAVAHAARLYGWRATRVAGEPLLLVLHIGYAWLALGYAIYALAPMLAGWSDTLALHGLLAGAVGTMTLAVMSRATLGHTGRALRAGATLASAFVAVQLAALVRLAEPWFGSTTWAAAGLLWSVAFAIFIGYCGPMLVRPHIATRR